VIFAVVTHARFRGRLFSAKTVRAPGLATPLIFIFFADRIVFSRVERYTEAWNLVSFKQALGDTPAIHFLRSVSNRARDRILTVGDHSRLNLRDHPNRLFFHDLSCADGYETMYPLRYHRLFGLLTAPSLSRDPRRAAYYMTWGERAYSWGSDVNNAIADLVGVRWMYVHNMPAPASPWKEVFSDGAERVFENPDVFPRTFVVPGARRFDDQAGLLSGLKSASPETLRSVAFVEAADVELESSEPPARWEPADGHVVLRRYWPDRIELDVHTRIPGVLVVTDAWIPGWIAAVDGVPAPVFPVDCAFQGVRVPAGVSRVLLKYRPTYTYAGFALAAMGVVVVGVIFAGGRRRTSTGA
jgi:hypothetical protein